MPWRRALYLAATMPHTAISPLTRLARRDSGFDVNHPETMTGKRIALLRGAAQAAILAELGFTHLVEGSSIDEINRFLLAGMADAAFGERAIIQSSLRMRGQEKTFRLGVPVRSTVAWLAGSLDFSEAEARCYRAAMAALVADGTQDRIFKKYGLA